MTDAELIERLRELAQWSADRHGYYVCDKDKTVAAMLEAQAADRIAALIAELGELRLEVANLRASWIDFSSDDGLSIDTQSAARQLREIAVHHASRGNEAVLIDIAAMLDVAGPAIQALRAERDALKADLFLAKAKNAKLKTLVMGRDTFIVNQGLWNDFTDALGYPKVLNESD